jgi:ABC-type polysaccharide/polyol phosphate export permease
MKNFVFALSVQVRVLYAVIVRDIGSKHGGEAVGSIWLLMEPLIITLVVIAIHQASGQTALQSVPIVVFLLTGYVPHLMFRHAAMSGITALNVNSGLLYHKQIHFLDLVFSRFFVEVVTVLIAFIVVYCGCYFIGYVTLPNSVAYIYLGWAYHIWFIMIMCFLFTGGCLYWPMLRRLFQPFALIMLFPYGAFFMLSWMSPEVRYYLLFFPPANASEIMRYGYFGPSQLTFFDIPYTTEACLLLTLLTLIYMFRGRRRVEL